MNAGATIPPFTVQIRVKRLAERRNYNHQLLNIPAAWQASKGGGITVGVLDTGMPEHSDLDIVDAWSAYDDYKEDRNGHGTHVAGLIAAHENGLGALGVAPECRLKTYTVLDIDGLGTAYALAQGINRACEDGCDIINMSLGISGPTEVGLLRSACESAAEDGKIIVAAAGNEDGMIDQPARYDCVIAVAAVDSDKQRAGFSNYGKELDFAVGGVDVYSTWLDGGYAKLSGTSMACPVFAGVCALILGEHRERELRGKLPGSPITDVWEMIEHVKRFAFDLGPSGWDPEHGFGMPVFQGPDKKPELSAKSVLMTELNNAIESLETVKAALDEVL